VCCNAASKAPKGIAWTLIINWAIKLFIMAFFAWIFFSNIYSTVIDPSMAQEYIAGAILLGAVAIAIMLFGIQSGAALVTVLGVLIEVPIMLSLVKFANSKRASYSVAD
jgi:ACR3 family arsenite efflux pump ArsB